MPGLATRSPEQQILAVFELASELSMPFCRSMVQQIFEPDSTSTEQTSDSLSATLLNAIKSALEKDQSSGLELLASLDNVLTNKVRDTVMPKQIRVNLIRYGSMPSARSSMPQLSSPRCHSIRRALAVERQHWSRNTLLSST